MNGFTWYICHHYHSFHSEQLHPLKDGSWKIAVGRRLSFWGKRPIVTGYIFFSGRVSHQIKTHLRWRVNTLPETNIKPKNGWFPIGISKLPGGPYFQVRTVSFREGLSTKALFIASKGDDTPISNLTCWRLVEVSPFSKKKQLAFLRSKKMALKKPPKKLWE